MMMMMMMIPIEIVLLLNVTEHGDDVQREQQPVPSALVHVTKRADGACVGDVVGNLVGAGVGQDGVDL